MWRRACLGVIAAGASVLLFATPAGAKFPQFELEVTRTEVAVGDPLHLKAEVASWAVEMAASNPKVLPMVEVYRTADLPVSGELVENVEPVQRVEWEHIGEGRYSGEVTLSEPGSYEIVSMNVWNTRLEGYPQPVSLTVTEAKAPNVAASDEFGLPLAGAIVATVGVTGLITFALARRRLRGHRDLSGHAESN